MNEDIQYIMSLERDKLEFVPYDMKKWQCCVKGCNRFTRVKDFGCSPYFYTKWRKWMNLRDTVLYCSGHWPGHEKIPNSAHKLGSGIIHLIDN